MKKWNVSTLVTLGMLLAIEIILSRFCSISMWNLKIGFSFVPIAVAAVLYGPAGGAAVAGLGDFLGANLFPIGPYFVGFTITAALSGMVLGLFLHKKQSLSRVGAAVVLNQLCFTWILNSLNVSLTFGAPFLPLLATRVIEAAVLIPTQILVIGAMTKVLTRYGKRAAA